MECSICKQDKPLTDFVYRKDRQKYQPHCKACKRNIDKAWAEANPALPIPSPSLPPAQTR